MDSFYYLIKLLLPHGVIRRNIDEASRIWSGYTLDEQREIYSRIRDKLRAGAFVSYYPDMAILENAPREFMEPKILSPEQQHLNMKAGIKMAVVRYKGHFPTVTADEAKRFNLEVLRYI